jgi:hypothetical protein
MILNILFSIEAFSVSTLVFCSRFNCPEIGFFEKLLNSFLSTPLEPDGDKFLYPVSSFSSVYLRFSSSP